MANNPSAKKRIRQTHKRRLQNRFKLVKARNLVRKFLATQDKAAAQQMLPQVVSSIDQLAKHNIIHANRAARQKSQLVRRVNAMA